jgi:hypothetical protein
MKKYFCILLIIISSSSVFSLNHNLWDSIRNSAYNSSNEIYLRYDQPNNGDTKIFFDYDSNIDSENMYQFNGSTYEAALNADPNELLSCRFRYDYNNEIGIMPKETDDSFPQSSGSYSKLTTDPQGDMSAGSYNNLDLTADYFAYSDNKFHVCMKNYNSSTGWPTQSSGWPFPSRYYIYTAQFRNPDDPNGDWYALVYVDINISFMNIDLNTGLYRITGEDISLESIEYLSGIETDVTDSSLKMAVDLSTLPSDFFDNYDNFVEMKIASGYIVTSSQDSFIADETARSFLFLENYEIAPFTNVEPYIAGLDFSGETSFSIDYFDENSNFPITAQFNYDGNNYNLVPDSDDFTGTIEYSLQLDETIDSGEIIFSDDNINYTQIEIIADESFENGDIAGNWVLSGDADWGVTNSTSFGGAWSAKSGIITDNQNSILELNVNIIESGNVSFWKKISSESSYDKLKFYKNSDLLDTFSGEEGWSTASYPVEPGIYTFTWEYSKDGSIDGGDDCAWIDHINFPMLGVSNPTIEVTTLSLNFGEIFVNENAQDLFKIKNIGIATLTGTITTPNGFSVNQMRTRENHSLKDIKLLSESNETDSRNAISFSVNPGDSLFIETVFSPPNAGEYSGSIIVSSNDLNNPTTEILVFGTGILPPEINISVASIEQELFLGDSANDVFRINNLGSSDLNYSINLVGQSRNEGGPDTFGNSWIDSNTPGYEYLYNWIDISQVGTEVLSNGDFDGSTNDTADDAFKNVIIPFQFPFYGEMKDEIKICSNGYLTFGENGLDYSNEHLPSISEPNDIIAALHDDLKPVGLVGEEDWGHVYYFYDEIEDIFIVEFFEVPHYGELDGKETFEIVLYPSGDILLMYNTHLSTQTDYTVGIQNSSGQDGLTISHNTDYLQDNFAVLISSTPAWFSLQPISGTIPATGFVDETIFFDSANLDIGTYNMSIFVHSNDPDNGLIEIPVTLNCIEQNLESPQNIQLIANPDNLQLIWNEVTNATSYKVYSSLNLAIPLEDWTLVGTVSETLWDVTFESIGFFYVKAFR